MLLRILLTTLIGIFSGIIGGATGLGGTFIMLPSIILLNIIPDYKTAVGTILLSMLPPISLFAVTDYYNRKKVDILIAVILCVSYMLSANYGAILNNYFSDKVLKYFTALMFFIISLYFLWTGHTGK